MRVSAKETKTEIRPWFLRSRGNLFLTLFLILAVPAAILTALITLHVRNDLEEKAVRQNSLTAHLVAQSVDEEFFTLRRYVEDHAVRIQLIDGIKHNDKKWLAIKLRETVKQNAKFSRAFVSDTSGTLLCDTPPSTNLWGKNFSDRDWFKGASMRDDAYVSEIYQRTNVDNAEAVTVATAVKDKDGQRIGYLGAQLTADRLAVWLHAMKPAANAGVELYDQRGIPVFHTSESTTRPWISEARSQEGVLRTQNPLTGKENIGSYVRIPSIDWTIIVSQSAERIFSPVETMLKTILTFFIVCFAGLIVVGYFCYDTLSRYENRRQQFEQELRNHTLELKRSNEELESLCYSIAHDLRAPLRSIRGFTSALREDYNNVLDPSGQNFTLRIDESAGRMDRLIQDLLDYGRLGHADVPMSSIPLQQTIDHVFKSLSEDIAAKNAKVEVMGHLPDVMANATLLDQVVLNLVSNGLKFVALGVSPEIKISAETRGNVVRIQIRDNGIGIDASHHVRIFGVFERLHNYESYPGTGIGLAIVRKAVERMGGKAGVESQPGAGSCFWVELERA